MALNTAEILVKLNANISGSQDLGNPVFAPELRKLLQFTVGTGANQADIFWGDTRTLAASATEDLDLSGVLADAFGAAIAAVDLVAIMVTALVGNTNNVILGDATQPVGLFGGTNPTFSVKPGGVFLAVAPGLVGLATIGAGATDDLKVTNSGGTTEVTYSVAILARTA